MQTFRSQDMQKQASTLQEAAMKEPILITYHDRPRLVLMSMEEYDRLRGRKGTAAGEADLSRGSARQIATLANSAARDFLITYSRGEISRSEAMIGIGLDPSDTATFAARMNAERIPWPKVDRQQAEKEADELLEAVGGAQ
ncbi:type II toxin-antitoxin system Phd/YefM family antitoxin [Microbacteriaceae bacterium K1510]|nr:type II toxin-antitoxin system Phd/YefM family antitoxin [Microbacteriaceae bacterium K1510]